MVCACKCKCKCKCVVGDGAEVSLSTCKMQLRVWLQLKPAFGQRWRGSAALPCAARQPGPVKRDGTTGLAPSSRNPRLKPQHGVERTVTGGIGTGCVRSSQSCVPNWMQKAEGHLMIETPSLLMSSGT